MIVKPKKGMTVDDLTNLIDEYDDLSDAVYGTDVEDDLSRVRFDLENLERFGTEDSYTHFPGLSDMEGYEMLGEGGSAFPVLWCAAGGDWEMPLVFIIYVGEDGKLHGYVPDDGNAYNHDKNAAYGNHDGDPSGIDEPEYVFCPGRMKGEILRRFL